MPTKPSQPPKLPTIAEHGALSKLSEQRAIKLQKKQDVPILRTSFANDKSSIWRLPGAHIQRLPQVTTQ